MVGQIGNLAELAKIRDGNTRYVMDLLDEMSWIYLISRNEARL